jgi:hypothetical protein
MEVDQWVRVLHVAARPGFSLQNVGLAKVKELLLNLSKQVHKNKQERQNVKLEYLKNMFGL